MPRLIQSILVAGMAASFAACEPLEATPLTAVPAYPGVPSVQTRSVQTPGPAALARLLRALDFPAAAAVTEANASSTLLDLFLGLDITTTDGRRLFRAVHNAMIDHADPAWLAPLIALLDVPFPAPNMLPETQRLAYHQVTACKVLARLRSVEAIGPLLKLMASPRKATLWTEAGLALAHIGPAASAQAARLLRGDNAQLKQYATTSQRQWLKDLGGTPNADAKQGERVAYVRAAARALGAIGDATAAKAILKTLDHTDSLIAAILALELPSLPRTSETLEAFKKVYLDTPDDLRIPHSNPARFSLLEAAPRFMDASLASWLIDHAGKLGLDYQGSERRATLAAVLKLMTAQQLPRVDALASVPEPRYNHKTKSVDFIVARQEHEDAYRVAVEVLDSCRGQGAACFLRIAVNSPPQTAAREFRGVKAAYMVGVLADPSMKRDIAAAIGFCRDGYVRYLLAGAIEKMSPRGDDPIADILQQQVDQRRATGDIRTTNGDRLVGKVIARLHARAR